MATVGRRRSSDSCVHLALARSGCGSAASGGARGDGRHGPRRRHGQAWTEVNQQQETQLWLGLLLMTIAVLGMTIAVLGLAWLMGFGG
jgi:hypothetical protein